MVNIKWGAILIKTILNRYRNTPVVLIFMKAIFNLKFFISTV